MKLQKMNDKQYFITLPNKLLKGFGWGKGDIIEYDIIGQGELKLYKKKG